MTNIRLEFVKKQSFDMQRREEINYNISDIVFSSLPIIFHRHVRKLTRK